MNRWKNGAAERAVHLTGNRVDRLNNKVDRALRARFFSITAPQTP